MEENDGPLGLQIIRILKNDSRMREEVEKVLSVYEYEMGGSIGYGQQSAAYKALKEGSYYIVKVFPRTH